MLFISCVVLCINTFGDSSDNLHTNIEAVVISDVKERSSGGFIEVEEPSASSIKAYRTQNMTYGYDALGSESERYLYDQIKENAYRFSNIKNELTGCYSTDRFTVSSENMSEQSIRRVLNAFLSDNPQIFWLENLFGYAYEGEDTIVECYSAIPADECTYYILRFNEKIDEILGRTNYTASDYDKEKSVHDIVTNIVKYKHGVSSSSDGWQYFSAYGAIVDGEAVCEGYAKAIQIILTRIGIPCYTIRGEAGGVGHMWNVVRIDGDWYHLDATWDDTDSDDASYEYFNLSDNAVSVTHTINEPAGNSADDEENSARYNFFIPVCSSSEMNYYSKDGITISRLDGETDEKTIDFIVRKASSGEHSIPIIFDGVLSYNEYLNSLFYNSPYRFYYYIDRANDRLAANHQIDRDSLKVLKNERLKTLRIKFEYK